MGKKDQLVVEKHKNRYVAYLPGLVGVVVGQGGTAEAALADAQSVVRPHVENFSDGSVAQMREQIDDLLIEGLDSGEPVELLAEDWSRIRREVRSRIEKRRALGRKADGLPP